MMSISLPPPYQSGEFTIRSAKDNWYAVTTFQNTLHLFSADVHGITQTQFSLSNLLMENKREEETKNIYAINTGKLKHTQNWLSRKVLSHSTLGGAVTATEDALWLFTSILPAGKLMGAPALGVNKYSLDSDQQAGWSPLITLLETDNKTRIPTHYPLEAGTKKIAAVALGKRILYACTATQNGKAPGYLYIGVYNPSVLESANGDALKENWPAESMLKIPFEKLQFTRTSPAAPTQPNFIGVGVDVDIDWFSQVNEAGTLQYYLALSLNPMTKNHLANLPATLFIPLGVDDAGKVSLPSELGSTKAISTYYQADIADYSSLRRDPAGRLKYFSFLEKAKPVTKLSSGFINTVSSPGIRSFESSSVPPLTLQEQWQSAVKPVGLFYIFEYSMFYGRDTRDFPVLEFVFGQSTHHDLRCQVNLYGNIQYDIFDLSPQQGSQIEPMHVLNGIIDGPIPLPLQNFKAGSEKENGGTLTYGRENSKTVERETLNKWMVGMKSNGKTTKGVGPAWDISTQGGMGKVSGTETKTVTSFEWSLDAPFLSTTEALYGYGGLSAVSAQIRIHAHRFLDVEGKIISDASNKSPGSSPKLISAGVNYIDQETLSYKPYAVIPGDLESYTAQSWNKRMIELGYEGDNYYGDVICRHAYPLNGNKHYLQMSWSGNSRQREEFTRFDASFIENTWSIDTENYVGVSGGEGFTIFGFGEAAEVELLAGFSFQHESSKKENTEHQWGIHLNEEWGPPIAPDSPEAVASYIFRLFFLPVPKPPSHLAANYWTQELIANLPEEGKLTKRMIDPNSGCWKIVFVVTDIIYNNGDHLDPPYDPSLERPSYYHNPE